MRDRGGPPYRDSVAHPPRLTAHLAFVADAMKFAR